MYISYKGTKYHCTCIPGQTMVYKGLPDDFPAPVNDVIGLFADDGFQLRTDNPSNYLRQVFENGVLTLTNIPEPEPMPEPGESEPTTAEILDALLGVTE